MSDIRKRTVMEVAPACVEHPVLADVDAYWNAKRGTRMMPMRAQLSPLDVHNHLCCLILLDALPGFTAFRSRLLCPNFAYYLRAHATGKTTSVAFASPG